MKQIILLVQLLAFTSIMNAQEKIDYQLNNKKITFNQKQRGQ